MIKTYSGHSLDIDRHEPKTLLEQGVQIVPIIISRGLGEVRWNIPMRSKDEIVRPRFLGPSWSELIRNRSNHLHLLPPDPLIPFLDKREITIPIEIDLLAILVFGKVIILQGHTFFLLLGPPPNTFFLPDTFAVVFPC
jgi:hypothetical protein